jgi:hypothetical protein
MSTHYNSKGRNKKKKKQQLTMCTAGLIIGSDSRRRVADVAERFPSAPPPLGVHEIVQPQ